MENSGVVPNVEKETNPQRPVLNVGIALREAREALGMSVHDVADRIKFAPRQVEALEANDFAHLPQTTFLRGFVRSYARVLQLDEVALIAALPSEPATTVAKTQVVNVSFPSARSLRSINVLWLAGALGIAIVLGLFVLLRDSEPVAKTSEVVESVPLPLPDVAASSVPNTEVEAPPKVSDKVAEQIITPKPAKVKKPAAETELQVVAVSAPEAIVKPPVPLETLKRRPLHFVFSEKAWAEVIDATGAVLLSRTNPAGTEQWVGGPQRAPYDISIAHPGSVKLYYRGEEIDLSAYAAMEVAHLKVE
jgi:cytoskeleton protein RodZ